jgi:LuxR family maltose regulon positive regulatory protein
MVELAIPALLRTRQEPVIRGWLDELPDAVVRARPVLAVGLIGTLMSSGEFEGVDARLREVERYLDENVAGEEEFRRLPGEIQLYRAALALVHGDLPATIGHAHRAVDRAFVDDHLTVAGASALLGLAYWNNGDLEAAHQSYSACVDGLRQAGNLSDILGCSIALADIRVTQGRLGEARRTYEQALLASRQDGTVLRGTADMYVGLSRLALERNDVDAATRHLLRSQELGEHTGLPQNPYRRRVVMAGIRQAQGDPHGALQLLDEAQQVYVGDFFPNVQPVPALIARLLTAQGELGAALGWAREQGLSVDDEVSYLHEFEHVTLARVVVAQGRTDDAARLLQRLLTAAEAGERTGSVIEILVLQALNHRARGDTKAALAALERALTLAEPEGYVRVFVGEGAPMLALLGAVAKQRGSRTYVRRLVDAFGESTPVTGAQGLVDPLSDRELQVLRLLGTDLAGPAIARELVVSLNTLRTHTRNIYAKLGVTNRRAAIRQAGELDLLSRNRER